MNTYDKLREGASSSNLLFPGHDRRLLENYPEMAQDITRLVKKFSYFGMINLKRLIFLSK